MPVIGTAGHVDHGKSTLIEALTGRDPDRWAEEKARGLTIDLGFAWTVLDDDLEVSFVDVPGHERFIKNMLAGTEAIDVALMVVAADEGWMPQSEEHLAVLDLLHVRVGVVALTKIDRVDDELRELAMLETSERLHGTSLERCPIIPVSAITGEGIATLRQALSTASSRAERERPDPTAPRLWVDRSFTIRGAGTVVTGTLLDGGLAVGDPVEIWPGGLASRVRSLQSHERDEQSVTAGRRCAVNLVGIDRDSVGRGSLLASAGAVATTTTAAVRLRTARYVDGGLDRRGAYHLHLGTGVWPVEFRPVSDERIDGNGVALIRAVQPFPAAVGDRFVLRETGRQRVVAGGQILDPGADPRPSKVRAHLGVLETLTDGTPDEAATSLLALRRVGSKSLLDRWTKGGRPHAALEAGDVVMSSSAVEASLANAIEQVEAFHATQPLRPGMPKASLASRLQVDLATLDALLPKTTRLRDDGSTVALAGFHAGLTPAQEERWQVTATTLAGAGLGVPRLAELDLGREMLHVLLREGRLVRVSDDLVYLPDQLAELQDRLAALPSPFTVADFRDTFDISRKYAVPLLEWLDARGVTARNGDTRQVRQGKGRPEGRP